MIDQFEGYKAGLIDALQIIARLPTAKTELEMNGHEDCYRAIERRLDASFGKEIALKEAALKELADMGQECELQYKVGSDKSEEEYTD